MVETEQIDSNKISGGAMKDSFSIMLHYLTRYKTDIFALSVMGIVSAVGNGTVPYIAGRFFDAVLDLRAVVELFGRAVPLFALLLVIWAVVQLITYGIDWKIGIKSEIVSNKAWTDYMADGISKVMTLPMSYHKTHKIGEVGDTIGRAGNMLETIIGRVVIDLAPQFLSIIIALVIGFFLQPILASFLVLGVIIFSLILWKSVGPLAGIQRDYYEAMRQSWGDSYDLLGNVQTIKQATAETYEQFRIGENMKGKILPLWVKMSTVWSNLSFYQRATILGTQLIIFILSIYYISRGEMTLGTLLAFNGYAAMLFGPFVTLGRNWQVVQNGLASIAESEKILNESPENYEPAGAPDISNLRGDIRFDDVDFYYEKGKPVLQGISFEARAGEVIALVGESGVGKSTLVDLVSGYHFPNSGTVRVDGYDIRTLNLKILRRQIGVVPQEVALFNDTILHNIKYGVFDATQGEVREAAEHAHALDFIEKFPDKWSQIVGERGVKLSVGQKQRVAIARAVLRKPRILILDEPTSALDAKNEKLISESLEALMSGRTTFIIAHRLSTVRRADKILVFKEGRIIESGKHEELLLIKDGEYKKLYEYQIGLHG